MVFALLFPVSDDGLKTGDLLEPGKINIATGMNSV